MFLLNQVKHRSTHLRLLQLLMMTKLELLTLAEFLVGSLVVDVAAIVSRGYKVRICVTLTELGLLRNVVRCRR